MTPTRQATFSRQTRKDFKLKKGLILVDDDENELTINGSKIKIVPAWKWLLNLG